MIVAEWEHIFPGNRTRVVRIKYNPETDRLVSARYLNGLKLSRDDWSDLEESLQQNVDQGEQAGLTAAQVLNESVA